MAFSASGFITVENMIGAVSGAPKKKHTYVTNDAFAVVEAAGYFNTARDNGWLTQGDIVEVAGDLDGTPFHSSYVFDTVPASGNVTITESKAVTQNVFQEVAFEAISTKAADGAVLRYVPSFAGTLDKIYTVLNAALATGDATFTAAIGGVAVTGGVVTATQAGSAASDVDVATPSAANVFAAGDVITVTVAGASTATATANLSMKMTPTG